MAKKSVILNKQQHADVLEIIKNMTCNADGEEKVGERFKVNRDAAYMILSAVQNNYKYLKIV